MNKNQAHDGWDRRCRLSESVWTALTAYHSCLCLVLTEVLLQSEAHEVRGQGQDEEREGGSSGLIEAQALTLPLGSTGGALVPEVGREA